MVMMRLRVQLLAARVLEQFGRVSRATVLVVNLWDGGQGARGGVIVGARGLLGGASGPSQTIAARSVVVR